MFKIIPPKEQVLKNIPILAGVLIVYAQYSGHIIHFSACTTPSQNHIRNIFSPRDCKVSIKVRQYLLDNQFIRQSLRGNNNYELTSEGLIEAKMFERHHHIDIVLANPSDIFAELHLKKTPPSHRKETATVITVAVTLFFISYYQSLLNRSLV